VKRTLRYVAALVLGLAVLTLAAWAVVRETTRRWFEQDLTLRAELAVSGARASLVAAWDAERAGDLREHLATLASNDRITATAACDPAGATLARTAGFPAEISCAELVRRVGAGNVTFETEPGPWHGIERIPSGAVHLSAIPVHEGADHLGFVVLVHDLAYVEQRQAELRRYFLWAFALLSLAASSVTVIASRLSWRNWSFEVRRFVRGESFKKEFQPILRDVRELVDRVLADRETEEAGAAWTAQRLKQTLNLMLHGERVIVVANREPYVHERGPDGAVSVRHPASGLVTAVEPIMRACSGVWIAQASGSADRETADAQGRLRVPPGEESYVLRRVWLTEEQERGYYYGFANEGLWPLCHIAHARPLFRVEDWEQYRAVNRIFRDALCEEADAEDPVVLVQDYHFALLPRLIRERLPRATILTFWHIPWPNSEFFGICPWRDELLEGLLGSSILGFHTQFHCNNFLDTVDRFLEARLDREQQAVVQQGQQTLVRPYPISVEWPPRWLAGLDDVKTCRAEVRARLGLAPDAQLGVGVDRLDYTKGIEERLLSVERLLERHPELLGRFTFVQLAEPSRTGIERYRQLNQSTEELAARINARFARDAYRPIVLLRSHHEPPEVYRHYRAADLCYVSSLHDGMNLVAKEFVAARDDEQGVLLLSQFTGAARELTEALVVNPYHLDEACDALWTALNMSRGEQRARMRSMRAYLAEFNVYRWAGRMLVDAARLRRRERVTGWLAGRLSPAAVRR
jgi:trehalose 6-phosphate synthase